MLPSASRALVAALPFLIGIAAPAAAGVIVYEHADFRGASRRIDGEVRDLRGAGFQDRVSSIRVESGAWEMCEGADFRGRCVVFDRDARNLEGTGLNDRISSVRPAQRVHEPPPERRPGGRLEITLYERTGFRGESRRFDGGVDNLNERHFNDRAMSVRVEGGSWELCENSDFGGRCVVLDRDVADLTDVGFDRRASSLRPVESGERRHGGWHGEITIFQHTDFRGRQLTIDQDVPDLEEVGMNDETSSVRIGRGSWELCEHRNYQGRCVVLRNDEPNLKRLGLNDSVSSIRRVRERDREY